MEQSSVIEVGFGVNYERATILDPKLIPQMSSKHDDYDAFISQYKTDLNPSAAIGSFKGYSIYMQDADLLYNSQKFWIPNMTVQDLS